tara:strand:+ start:316 stop:735 length:420 start_codon:yes stop_codon:yes gene_type:complete
MGQKMKTTNLLIRCLILIATLTITSCASIESAKDSKDIESAEFVYMPKPAYAEEVKFFPLIKRVLEKHGFIVTDIIDEAELSLDFQMTGSAILSTILTLRKGNVPLIIASSTNPGFGTWIARPAAKSGLVQTALEKLDK